MARVKKQRRSKSLPEDLLFFGILSKLPVKSLLRFRAVSKTWKARISDDSFSRARLNQQPGTDPLAIVIGRKQCPFKHGPQVALVLYNPWSKAAEGHALHAIPTNDDPANSNPAMVKVKILGSCDGLICLNRSRNGHSTIQLWNPATHQLRDLPDVSKDLKACCKGTGFGFDTATGDYKVVKLIFKESLMYAEVFDRRGAAWRACSERGGIPMLTRMLKVEGSAVAVNGALHWYAKSGDRSFVLSFDLHHETLRLADGPSVATTKRAGALVRRLCLWKGSLAAYSRNKVNNTTMHAIWVSHGDQLCWNKVFEIKTKTYSNETVRAVWRDLLLFVRHVYGDPVYLLGPETDNRPSFLKLPRSCSIVEDLYDYVESIVSVL